MDSKIIRAKALGINIAKAMQKSNKLKLNF